jgi:hypothetical protein
MGAPVSDRVIARREGVPSARAAAPGRAAPAPV